MSSFGMLPVVKMRAEISELPLAVDAGILVLQSFSIETYLSFRAGRVPYERLATPRNDTLLVSYVVDDAMMTYDG